MKEVETANMHCLEPRQEPRLSRNNVLEENTGQGSGRMVLGLRKEVIHGDKKRKKNLLISLTSVSVLPILQSLRFKLTLVIFYLFKTPKYLKYL